MKRIYLDYSATTPLDPEALRAMQPYFSGYLGNPSSVHAFGREARLALEEARETLARSVGARPDEIFFTSGGTESDNHAVKGTAHRAVGKRGAHVLVSAVEHHAVLHPALSLRRAGFEVELLPVDSNGRVDPEDLRRRVRPETILVSVMHANNEVGTIQPIAELAAITRPVGIPLHTDAVQSFGKIPVNVAHLGVDLMSLSGHKIYGPRGIGVLFVRKGTPLEPLLEGGSQERNLRAGTENVALAVGFAKAAELAVKRRDADAQRLSALKKLLRGKLENISDGILWNGHGGETLPSVLSLSFDSSAGVVDGEALIMGMDLEGVAVTSGSACTSGTLEPSHVLLAMGRDEATARATIRFSMGRATTEEDLEAAANALKVVLARIRKAR